MPPFEWNFEAREVEFNVTVQAIFDNSIGTATVALNWLDDTVFTVGQLCEFEPTTSVDADEENQTRGKRWPNAKRTEGQKQIGTLKVDLDLVRKIQHSRLSVLVYPPSAEPADAKGKGKGKGDEGGVEPVVSRARVFLGPLLVADAATADDENSARQKVAAIETDTIGLSGLYSLKMYVSTVEPVLSREMLSALLPATFVVDAVRGLQIGRNFPDLYKDVSLQVYPAVNRVTKCIEEECKRYYSCTCQCQCQGKCECKCQCRGSHPHNTFIRFSEPVTWLLGLAPRHAIREWMQHQGLVVEIHDHDSRVLPFSELQPEAAADGEPPPDDGGDDGDVAAEGDRKAKPPVKRSAVLHPHGVAHFNVAPLLKSKKDATVLTLRADVHPRRGNKKIRLAELMMETPLAKGLLEEEGQQRLARRAVEGKREETSNYHKDGTVCTLRAALALPIPSAAELQACEEIEKQEGWASTEVESPVGSSIWKSVPLADEDTREVETFRAKIQVADGDGFHVGPWRRRREDAEDDLSKMSEDDHDVHKLTADLKKNDRQLGLHRRYEKYGRAVLVFRDDDTANIRRVLAQVRQQNSQTLRIDPLSAALATYQFSDAELADSHLDLLTGFMVLDGQIRLMVIEGLRDGGLEQLFEKAVMRHEQPNSASFKILYHPEIGFSDRLYMGFGPTLKTIKIRQSLVPLEKLASKADLYSSAGNVDEVTIAGKHAPKMLVELKRFERQRSMRMGESFPEEVNLRSLETLFGGYLSDEEIDGLPYLSDEEIAARNGPIKSRKSISMEKRGTFSAEELQQALLPAVSEESSWTRKPKTRTVTNHANPVYEQTLAKRKSQSTPNFQDSNREAVKVRSEVNMRVNDLFGKKRVRETPFLEGKEVFLYSQQKLNSAELQKEWMRSSMDPQMKERSWTYNPSYMSAGFEFSGAPPPGVPNPQPCAPNDTYARLPEDKRPVWRLTPARQKEEFRKPTRDLGHARPEELQEQFVENEWHQLAVGAERRRPIAQHVRFEPDKIPHTRVQSEKPFDPSRVSNHSKEFGPKSYFESIHYHAHGQPGEGRDSEVFGRNDQERKMERERDREVVAPNAKASMAHLGKRPGMSKSFSYGVTRQGITDLDRHEKTFKPDKKIDRTSMFQAEEYHERGRPDKEFQSRMRENDDLPPYDVATDTYVTRDPEVGLKRACISGTLGKAPWRHGASKETNVVPHGHLPGTTQMLASVEYSSKYDFDRTKKPPRSKICENQVWKNASRTAIGQVERTHVAYKRPVDYGAHYLSAQG